MAPQWPSVERGKRTERGDLGTSVVWNRSRNENREVWQKKKTLRHTLRIYCLPPFFFYDLQSRLDHFIQFTSPPYRWTFMYCTFFTESLSFPSPSMSRELQTLRFRHPFPLILFLPSFPVSSSPRKGEVRLNAPQGILGNVVSHSLLLAPQKWKVDKGDPVKTTTPGSQHEWHSSFLPPSYCLPLPPLRGSWTAWPHGICSSFWIQDPSAQRPGQSCKTLIPRGQSGSCACALSVRACMSVCLRERESESEWVWVLVRVVAVTFGATATAVEK